MPVRTRKDRKHKFSAKEDANGGIGSSVWLQNSIVSLEDELARKYGEDQRGRAARGLKQTATLWRTEDGGQAEFEDFVRTHFAGTQSSLDVLFARFEALMEKLHGHMHEIGREFRQQLDLDLGAIQPYDETFSGYDPSAHIIDDFFANKLAFVVLLNFPLTTIAQRLADGEMWTRRQWAEARLTQQFSKRIPAGVNLEISKAAADVSRYVAEYNIWMHHLVTSEGERLFPPRMRLLSHWGLRDEIKSDYADEKDGLRKQRTIQRVMERIIDQTIPRAVIDNFHLDWNPFTNEVIPAVIMDSDIPRSGQEEASPSPEGIRRYEKLLVAFRAARLADPYSPAAPTLIARRFDEDREIPEARVKEMLEQVLTSPLVPRIAALIGKRLGRPLEPFDLWYNGFRSKQTFTNADLDEIVAARYSDAEAYRRDIPNLLMKLGFPQERAECIAANIIVDAARGSGHAMGAGMRGAKAHLRTRIEKSGMNYEGFNVAAHEIGHNVEQTLSMNDIDHYLLNGVPNTAFTEAFAFLFQGRDLELLGLEPPAEEGEALKALNDFWSTYEISGVALVDTVVWHWMYDNPEAPAELLKAAVIRIAQEVWNEYYASVFQRRDATLLAIYSHMIDSFLYLPDYPIGHLIAHQVEEKMKSVGAIGPEMERMVRSGSIAPDLWMRNATQAPVGAHALLAAAARALSVLENSVPSAGSKLQAHPKELSC